MEEPKQIDDKKLYQLIFSASQSSKPVIRKFRGTRPAAEDFAEEFMSTYGYKQYEIQEVASDRGNN